MIVINGKLQIPEAEIQFDFIRASGPGGQNVNKVSSAVQLRFNVSNNSSLPRDVKERIIRLAGRKVTASGTLIIDARQHRTQNRNKQDALERLLQLLHQATIKPKNRVKTKPSRASITKRLDSKKHRAGLKKLRRGGNNDW
ncbi:MAG: aminoacyl-tRNA hydrolase [Magnetococcales bacterium]|nr:aminoacyl-tRNA hydrolase [Magnetococcales bacterium]